MLTIEIASPEIGRIRFEPQLTVQEKLLALNPEDQELVKQEMGRQLQRFTQLLTVAIAAGGEIAEDVFAQMDVAVSNCAEATTEKLIKMLPEAQEG